MLCCSSLEKNLHINKFSTNLDKNVQWSDAVPIAKLQDIVNTMNLVKYLYY